MCMWTRSKTKAVKSWNYFSIQRPKVELSCVSSWWSHSAVGKLELSLRGPIAFPLFIRVECIHKELHSLLHMERHSEWLKDLWGLKQRYGFYWWSQKCKTPHKLALTPSITWVLKQLLKDLREAVVEHDKAHKIPSSSTIEVQVQVFVVTIATLSVSAMSSSSLHCEFQL